MVIKEYLNLESGQLHFAKAGETGPRIVLLHESPLSNRVYFDVMERMSTWSQVFAPDTPGYGQSTPLSSAATLSDFASKLIEGIRLWSKGEKVIVSGVHTGASLSVEIANQAPELCAGLLLIGLPTYTEEMRALRLSEYAPSVEIKEDGSHVMWAWDRYRKMWPTAPLAHIQLATADLIYNLERYNWAYLEAFKYRSEEKIKNVKCPILMSAAEGEFLYEGTKLLAEIEGHEFLGFPGLDWQGQVSLRNPDDLDKALKDFALSL
jgi:pimeloyl-ACP methyl ester carboxylesterase